MNKRDEFAKEAMKAIISKIPPMVKFEDDDDEDFADIYLAVATGAYGYADAMMFVRELGEE